MASKPSKIINFIKKKRASFTKSNDDGGSHVIAQSNGTGWKGGLCKPAPHHISDKIHHKELKKIVKRLENIWEKNHEEPDWLEKCANAITHDLTDAFKSTKKLEECGKDVANIISAIVHGTWSKDMHSKAVRDINTNLSLFISDFFDTLHGWSRENAFSLDKRCHRIGSKIDNLEDQSSPYPPQYPWGPEPALKGKYAKIYWFIKDLSMKHSLTIDPKNKVLSCVENCDALSGEIYRYFAFLDPHKRALTVKEDGTIDMEIYDFTNPAQLWRIENYGKYYALYNKRCKKYFSIQSNDKLTTDNKPDNNWSSTAVLLIEKKETNTYSIGYTRNNKDIKLPEEVRDLRLVTIPLITWRNTENNQFAGVIDSNGTIGFSDGEYFEKIERFLPRPDQLFLFVPHPDFKEKATVVAHNGKYMRFAPTTEGPTIRADNDLKETKNLAFSLFNYEQNVWPRQVHSSVSVHYLASRLSQALIHLTGGPGKFVCLNIWKADPSVKNIGIRKLCLPNNDITVGPSDSWFDVKANCSPVYPDHDGNFLLEFDEKEESSVPESESRTKFDVVHCFGVCRYVCIINYLSNYGYAQSLQLIEVAIVINSYVPTVFNLLLSDLEYLDGKPPQVDKPWGERKLTIIPHAGEEANAYYDREDAALKFFYIVQDNKPLYLCRSLDIVSHETGHAFLDILQNDWLVDGQTGALHEAFGDLTTMFTILSMKDMVDLLIECTKSDLRSADNFVAAVGEEFGDLVYKNKGKGIRNLSNKYRGSSVGNETHILSLLFSGFVYDVLVDIFELEKTSDRSDSDTLFEVAQNLRRALIIAVRVSSHQPSENKFQEIATNLETSINTLGRRLGVDLKGWQEIVRDNSLKRELSVAGHV
ncbi:24414_t:CDS:10 [Dentiscutata erythropus]|uniref:24414_t:CDS:1 n=1 Tax=Dentiscutata erythropus TaxID=1348616 RepID=A0A9N9A6V9_9GLOM|nr:24414_t:CDS:10 [Dentiscutata erythropus]